MCNTIFERVSWRNNVPVVCYAAIVFIITYKNNEPSNAVTKPAVVN